MWDVRRSMANLDFLFLVKTPGTYPVSGRSRPRLLNSEARSHAAMAYHRKKNQAERKNPFDAKQDSSKRTLRPKSNSHEDREADATAPYGIEFLLVPEMEKIYRSALLHSCIRLISSQACRIGVFLSS